MAVELLILFEPQHPRGTHRFTYKLILQYATLCYSKGDSIPLGVAMPNFISAYELQQRDGLTRQRVIELAEIGPAYWWAKHEDFLQTEDQRGYWDDGFKYLQSDAVKIWRRFIRFCNRISAAIEEMRRDESIRNFKAINISLRSECFDQSINSLSGYEELPAGAYGCVTEEDYRRDSSEDNSLGTPSSNGENLMEFLQNRWAATLSRNITKILPTHIDRHTARNLIARDAVPDVYLKATDDKDKTQSVLNDMGFHQLLNLFDMPKNRKTAEDIWKYLKYFHDENDHRSTFIDLFFQHLFTGRLAFDADNLPGHKKTENFMPELLSNNAGPASGTKRGRRLPYRRILEIIASEAAKHSLPNKYYVRSDRTIRNWLDGTYKPPDGFSEAVMESQDVAQAFAEKYIKGIVAAGSSELAANAKREVPFHDQLHGPEINTAEDAMMLSESYKDLAMNLPGGSEAAVKRKPMRK